MRRLLLVNPALDAGEPGTGRRGNPAPTLGGVAAMEPLGLAYVAALTPPGWQIRLWDEVVEPAPPPGGAAAVAPTAVAPTAGAPTAGAPTAVAPDLVGITATTATAPRAYELAAGFRRLGVPVVLGGPHPTLLPDEAAAYADAVFRGEAEGAWPALIADFEAGGLRPRYEGGGPPLDDVVWPRRDVYRRRYNLMLVSASRGCRYRCEFCAIWKLDGGALRLRPVEQVWAELSACRLPGAWATLFTDDNIAAERDWAVELFRGMAERGLQRRFAVQASLSIADEPELLRWLRRAGCFAVMTGLESVSEESLRRMRKGVNLRFGVEGYRERIRRIHTHGMMVAGSFMFGNDGDGPDIFSRTAQFVLDAGVDLAHFGILTPNVGTDLYARLEAEGRLLYTTYPEDYRRHQLDRALFTPQGMSTDDLETGYRRSVNAVSRWPVVLRRSWRTWRDTGNAFAALAALAWTRTGLRARLAPQGLAAAGLAEGSTA